MVLKKPYAFLIKYFKIIHLILSALLIFLAFKLNNIVTFFRQYASSGFYESVSNLAGTYITFFMYIAVILILCITIFIYMLMRNKKKSTKFYVGLIAYYIFIFILLSLTFSIFQSLEQEIIDSQTARIYRDLSLLFSLPQYFFIIYSAMRGLGFDLKKFNFQLDLKEMEIEATDDEEIELTVGIETYKAQRTVRRFFREFKYYVIENTFIFICIFAIIGIIIGTGIFLNVNVYNKVYKETESFSYKNFNLTINNSYITSKDYKGNSILKDKYYLVLNINIQNNSTSNVSIKTTDFRLKINNENIYPTKNKADYFSDLGTIYKGDKLKGNSKDNYVLIFEINKEYIRNNYIIKILDSINYNVGDIQAKYKDVKVEPQNLDTIKNVKQYKLQEKIDLSESTLGNSFVSVSNYNLTSTYKYKYDFCIDKICTESTDVITPDYSFNSNSNLLVLDYELTIDKNSSYAKKSDNSFFTQFSKVRYVKNNQSKTVKVKNLTPDELKGKIVLQVDANIKTADSVELLFVIRNKEYSVKIK